VALLAGFLPKFVNVNIREHWRGAESSAERPARIGAWTRLNIDSQTPQGPGFRMRIPSVETEEQINDEEFSYARSE
jgi:hypothetical protein